MTFETYWASSEDERMRSAMGTLAAIASTQTDATATKVSAEPIVPASDSWSAAASPGSRGHYKTPIPQFADTGRFQSEWPGRIAAETDISVETVERVLSTAQRLSKDS